MKIQKEKRVYSRLDFDSCEANSLCVFFSMSFTGVKSLALALGNNQGNYRENLDTSEEDVNEAMSRRKPMLKCACDLRYCNQNFCMTDGVCFASARRKTKQIGKIQT